MSDGRKDFFRTLVICRHLIKEKQLNISTTELIAGLLDFFHTESRRHRYGCSNNEVTIRSRLARQKARSMGICYICFKNPVDYSRSKVACTDCLDKEQKRRQQKKKIRD